MNPSVSVLMPIHNPGGYLAESVQSILCQTFVDFEFIIVDDGSTDGSTRYVQETASQDPRVHLIEQSRSGVTAALNNGLSMCGGEVIARMDGDDIADPQRFERQFKFLQVHSDVVAVGCWTLDVDPENLPIGITRWAMQDDQIQAALLRGKGGLPHPGAMMRAEAVRAVGGYRDEFMVAQDKDLWLRLGEHGQLANIPEVLLRYRRHSKSIGHARATEQARAVRRAVLEARQRRGLAEIDAPDVGLAESRSHNRHEEWALRAASAGHYQTARKYASLALSEAQTDRFAVRMRLISVAPWLGRWVYLTKTLGLPRSERTGI